LEAILEGAGGFGWIFSGGWEDGGGLFFGGVMITRAGMRAVNEYVERVVQEEDRTRPDKETQRTMAVVLDESAERVANAAMDAVRGGKFFEKAKKAFSDAPRLCGGFTEDAMMFRERTTFEQMTVLSDWIDAKGAHLPKKTRTYTLAGPENEIIPLWVKPPKQKALSTMHVVIGNGRGDLKGPVYADWAVNDPEDSSQKRFIEVLNSLEIVRQPRYTASLLMKSNAYEAGRVANSWRYGVMNDGKPAKQASVELPKQSSPTKAVRETREKSAGYNLVSFIEDDRMFERSILPGVRFEDYSDEDYDDDNIPDVTPRSILVAVPDAMSGETDKLDAEIGKLFATQMAISGNEDVKRFTRKLLFGENQE
jgi:hypothetical protein